MGVPAVRADRAQSSMPESRELPRKRGGSLVSLPTIPPGRAARRCRQGRLPAAGT